MKDRNTAATRPPTLHIYLLLKNSARLQADDGAAAAINQAATGNPRQASAGRGLSITGEVALMEK
jgi:hypothetical protein